MKLTTQQLTQLKEVANNETIDLLKQWYPEKFEVEKKVHTFYYAKGKNGDEFLFAYYSADSNQVYGFNRGEWKDNESQIKWVCHNLINDATLATEEQILKFMIPEAKKRGYKNGNYKCMLSNINTYKVNENQFFFSDGHLWHGVRKGVKYNKIFEKGKWAEIIQTYTKEEAEKILNAKIIN
jgi:hypothetical protein